MIKNNVDITRFTTFRIKSLAREFMEARTREDLIEAKKYSVKNEIPLLVIGGGSNTILLSDFRGLVVRNLYMKTELIEDHGEVVDMVVSSGYPVSRLIAETTEKGYEGFEYHLGLPGTVGGAIYMNSKWTKPEIYFGDNLLSANIVDKDGSEKKVDKEYFHFAYDYSKLQDTGDLLLDAVFRLKKNSPSVLKKRAKDALEYRKQTQPFGVATGGCIFQNIDGQSAGELIDKAGLKGTREGAFVVSDIHANFVINEGDGAPNDLKKLLDRIKSSVKEKFGVDLKEEVRIIS